MAGLQFCNCSTCSLLEIEHLSWLKRRMYLKSILSDWYWRLDRYIQDSGLGLRIRNWEFVNKNYSLIFETEDGDFYVTASPIYK